MTGEEVTTSIEKQKRMAGSGSAWETLYLPVAVIVVLTSCPSPTHPPPTRCPFILGAVQPSPRVVLN